MSRNYNPLDRKGQEAAQAADDRAKQLALEQLRADVQWLMGDARGRRLMRRWLAFCGVDRVPFTGDSKTFFRCGEQNVGLMLKAQATEHAIEDYFQMLREHLEESSK